MISREEGVGALDADVSRPRVRVWTREECQRLHEATLEILAECGVEVRHDEALALLRGAGARIEKTRAFIPSPVVEKALGQTPRRVQIGARGRRRRLLLGAGQSYFGTGPDCLYVADPSTGDRRRARLEDVRSSAALCERLPNVDFVMSMGLPEDTDQEAADLAQFAAMLAGTGKPVIVSSPRGAEPVRVMLDMASMAGDGSSFACLIMSSPPLQLDGDSADKLVGCARMGVPAVLAPAPAAGSTAPATVAGTVLVGNTEVIAGLVVNQLASPGAPFVYGVGAGTMDMRTTVDAYARPEHFLGNQVACEMGRFYGLPTWSYAGVSDSKVFDEQWAVEAATTALLGGLSGADLLHDVGYLESGMQSSLETTVLGDVLVGYVRRVLRGVPTDDEAVAIEEIRAAGPGGNHLARRYTREHRRDFWTSSEFDHSVYDRWLSGGAERLKDRVVRRTRELLASPPAYSLPAEVEAQLYRMAGVGVGG